CGGCSQDHDLGGDHGAGVLLTDELLVKFGPAGYRPVKPWHPVAWSLAMIEDLLRGIVADPQAEDRWLVLADFLEEKGDPRSAELLRLHRRLLATCCEPERHPERAVWQARIVSMLADGVKPCVPQRTVALGEGVGMTFNFIQPGTFLMGSPPQEEGRQDD